MTTPTEDHEVDEVEIPLRLQPVVARPDGWRGRSINLIAVGLVGFVMIGLLLGTAFDNSGPSSSASVAVAVSSGSPGQTARPTRRPTPTPKRLATPLPTLEVNGTDRPSERRLVNGNGQEILDVGSGTLRSFGRTYEDLLWPDEDEFVCVCLVRAQGVNTTTEVTLQFGRFDLAGRRLVERDLVTLEGIGAVPEMTEGFNVSATMDASGGHLFVVDVVRTPPVWIVELHIVDLDTGRLLDSAVIDTFPVDLEEPRPSASPRLVGSVPDGRFAWVNTVAAAPDGGSVFVTVAQSEVRGEVWTSRNLEWFVPIRDGKAGDPLPMPEDARLAPDRWCIGRPMFTDAELLVQVCGPPPTSNDGSFWTVRRVTTSGELLGDLPIGAARADGSPAAPLVDRARRAVYLWDAFRHLVSRVDIDTGRAREGVVDESVLRGDRSPSGRGWIGVDPGIVFSADGTRLYALGLEAGTGNAGRPTGIWVFDADTLEVLDHWQPRALLTSLAVSADGRFVYAAGAAGYDADGHENERWPASLTVYNATTGEIAVLHGAIGEGQWLGFPSGY